jgi:hypothetical protein
MAEQARERRQKLWQKAGGAKPSPVLPQELVKFLSISGPSWLSNLLPQIQNDIYSSAYFIAIDA